EEVSINRTIRLAIAALLMFWVLNHLLFKVFI
ncbi:unnamed protein product, partial [marine sediment metagenome]